MISTYGKTLPTKYKIVGVLDTITNIKFFIVIFLPQTDNLITLKAFFFVFCSFVNIQLVVKLKMGGSWVLRSLEMYKVFHASFLMKTKADPNAKLNFRFGICVGTQQHEDRATHWFCTQTLIIRRRIQEQIDSSSEIKFNKKRGYWIKSNILAATWEL